MWCTNGNAGPKRGARYSLEDGVKKHRGWTQFFERRCTSRRYGRPFLATTLELLQVKFTYFLRTQTHRHTDTQTHRHTHTRARALYMMFTGPGGAPTALLKAERPYYIPFLCTAGCSPLVLLATIISSGRGRSLPFCALPLGCSSILAIAQVLRRAASRLVSPPHVVHAPADSGH